MTTERTNRSVRTEQLPSDHPAERPTCPHCGSRRVHDEQFCESCGHDCARPAPWSLEISADRAYFERVASGLTFPSGRMAAVLVFEGDEVTIGRHDSRRDSDPDVDLSDGLADPAVSHLHAAIRRDPATRSFTVVDLGSTNGTTINHDEQPVEPDQGVAIVAGDQLHVGAWTTIRFTV